MDFAHSILAILLFICIIMLLSIFGLINEGYERRANHEILTEKVKNILHIE